MGVAYEVSLLAADPGIEGGRVCEEMAELMDINPTLCDRPGQPDIDAQSFAGWLRDDTEAHRDRAVSHEQRDLVWQLRNRRHERMLNKQWRR